ncbi:DAK2 domain-containing protein [Paenibacillaceae bacterium]|nr:DAK2 domain-containing protein [Paenibacillaceae bacterium]
MSKRLINGSDFANMVYLGAEILQEHADHVNALNVFPVPDGDTGTNMSLTMSAGSRELNAKPSQSIGKAAEVLSKGLLMGARGNSGVILSQLFRGFARSFASAEEVGTVQFAAALQHGVDTAYKAVVKPVEGTILTVAKDSAKHAVFFARRTSDLAVLMREVYAKAQESLARTPDLLPVLKQVGVVDSGGQGLVYIFEGFLKGLTALEDETAVDLPRNASAGTSRSVPVAGNASPAFGAQSRAQSRLATETIEFLYDMEFFINCPQAGRVSRFDAAAFKRALAKDGDSIIVIEGDDIIKVHVHSRKPGDVLNYALQYGELTEIHILNMRDQHRDLLQSGEASEGQAAVQDPELEAIIGADKDLAAALPELLTGAPVTEAPAEPVYELAPYGIVGVAMGDGIASIFADNNADIVLSGGQTMNPSTEDFVQAIASLHVEHVFLLPNNANIILAAQQAAELSGRSVSVISTRTIPQGLAALLAFKDYETPDRNAALMQDACDQVQSGQVTHAVRDTVFGELVISEGDYIGIQEKTIVAASSSMLQTCQELLTKMIGEGGELLTILTGLEASEEDTEALSQWLASAYPDVELEVHSGGQPLYPYLFAVE